jgi:hypothetical protein
MHEEIQKQGAQRYINIKHHTKYESGVWEREQLSKQGS